MAPHPGAERRCKLSRNARRVRHPHQVMDASGLSVGARYAFVMAERRQPTECLIRAMAGEVGDAVGLAMSRGWNALARAAAGIDTPLAALLDNFRAFDTGAAVTVHPDGWRGCETKAPTPTLVYWSDGNQVSWDPLHTFLGPSSPLAKELLYTFHAVVPEERWLANPNMYERVAWRGADQSAADPAGTETPADFDRRMRAKLDRALRKRLGF